MARVEGVIGGEGEVIYYHHDNLGSTRLMTNEQGEVVFDQDYLPFGGDLAVVGDLEPQNGLGEKYKYTGQREETSIGLYYYGARFYDPELGRFISEDTYTGELTNPQSENVYIYTLNNPIKYVDPTGHDAIGPINAKKLIKDYEDYTPIEIDRDKIEREYAEYKNNVVKPYLRDTAKMIIAGDYSNKFTKLGVAAQVGLDAIGIDAVADFRDFTASIKNRDYLGMTLNGIGLVPLIGMVQNFKYFRHVDDVNELKHLNNVTTGERIVESVGEAELGRKLDYVFGKATGSKHNIARSVDMERQLNRIGIYDNVKGRNYLQREIKKAFKDTTNATVQENGRILKESLLTGPNGVVKVQSVWEENKLITVQIFGGGK